MAGQRQIVIELRQTELKQHSRTVKIWRAVGGGVRSDDLRMLSCGRQPRNESVHFSRSQCPPDRCCARADKISFDFIVKERAAPVKEHCPKMRETSQAPENLSLTLSAAPNTYAPHQALSAARMRRI